MRTRDAMIETMRIVESRLTLARHLGRDTFHSRTIGYQHTKEMMAKVIADPDMSEGKLNRWLGWVQCSVCSWGIMSLDEAKEINRRHS